VGAGVGEGVGEEVGEEENQLKKPVGAGVGEGVGAGVGEVRFLTSGKLLQAVNANKHTTGNKINFLISVIL